MSTSEDRPRRVLGMERHLAVRPTPYTGESLASFAGRLAGANHISITELMNEYYPPVRFRYGHPDVTGRLAALTGVPRERLQQMAHPIVAGGTGSRKGFLGIRTRGQVICHHCHGEDGIRLLEWDHPLITVCVYCNGLLAPVNGSNEHVVPPRQLLLDVTEVREIFLNAHDPGWAAAWDRVVLLTRMGRTIARNLSSTWPRSRVPAVREAARRVAADFADHPSRRDVASPPSLDLVLVTIATCWDHTLDPVDAEQFLRSRIRAANSRENLTQRRITQGRAEVSLQNRRSPAESQGAVPNTSRANWSSR